MFRSNTKICDSVPVISEQSQSYGFYMLNVNVLSGRNIFDNKWSSSWQAAEYQNTQQNRDKRMNCYVGITRMNVSATPFKSTVNCAAPSIGWDLWQQLKRVQTALSTIGHIRAGK